jgi:outer membrane receptor protein involved in Fe transport
MNASREFAMLPVALAVAAYFPVLAMAQTPAPPQPAASAPAAPAPQPEPAAAPAPAPAAPASAAPARTDAPANEAQTIVVTGTARREGLRKLDASFSITTADEEQIKQSGPASTADILKVVPGVFVETSGGQSGANMRVRGFPTPGDGPYSTFQLNGAPLYHLPTLSFFEHSQIFRLDDTIERLEVLRGGPSPVFGSGQPGITVNFIQKQGTAAPEGSLRLTGGTGNLRRVDGVYSGPLADKWSVMIGGFFRSSNGLRDTEFPADRGGQISGALTRKLDDGSLTLYARQMRDRNAFFTAIPVVGGADGSSVSSYPGFNALRDYFYGNELRNITLESGRATGRTLPGGAPEIERETVRRDLADGRGANVRTLGANLDTKVGDWVVNNKLSYTSGSVPTYALFSGANPQALGSYIDAQVTAANGSAAVVAAAGGVATTGSASFANGGAPITDLNTRVIVNGMWVVDKKLESLTNETRLSYELNKQNTLTLGLYLADYSSRDEWYLGQAQLMTVQRHARPINVQLDNGVSVSKNGYVPPPFSFNLNGSYSGTTTALYLANEWKATDQLRVDGGVRYEMQRVTGTIENVANGDLDADPLTLYNNNYSYFDGTSRQLVPGGTSKLNRTSFTAGANYNFTPTFSAFVRANKGYRMPDFDVLRGRGANEVKPPVESITQAEVGLKTVTPLYSAFLTLYQNRLTNSQTQQFTNAGNQVLRPNSKATGLEFEMSLRPLQGFEIAATGNLQDAKYNNFRTATDDFSGNTIERAPKVQFRLTPSYRVATPIGSLRLYGTLSHVGERFADQTNTLKLPKYQTVDAGAVLFLTNGLEFRVSGSNLTNKVGLTEGNFRVPGAAVGQDGVFLARPLFGRAFEVSVGAAF